MNALRWRIGTAVLGLVALGCQSRATPPAVVTAPPAVVTAPPAVVTAPPAVVTAPPVDLDDDGAADAYDPATCRVRRRRGGRAVEVALGTRSQPENSECFAPLRVGRRWLFPVRGRGHETDEGRSSSWVEATLALLPADADSADAWTSRFEDNDAHPAGDYAFASLGPDAVVISANVGDVTPAGQVGPMFQVVRWEAVAQRLVTASCWQPARPAAVPAVVPGCTARPGAALRLRDTETLRADGAATIAAGTALDVLSVGTMRRGAATLHCVRAPDGQVGYAFVLPGELTGCAALAR
jgi:hypothetical protein